MAIIIDIVGALVIAGIIMLAVLGLNEDLTVATYNKTFTLLTQTNAVALARMIESDFVKMGYHTPVPAVLAAGPDSIVFLADLHDAGTVNTVKYRIGPTGSLGFTKNPRDRILYRVEDGVVTAANLGVTSLTFSYYRVDGYGTSAPDSVKSINVTFVVQSPEPTDSSYSEAVWQKKIYPKNL